MKRREERKTEQLRVLVELNCLCDLTSAVSRKWRRGERIASSRSRWGCQITDRGLYQLSTAKCISILSSLSLWGTTGITDTGVVQLISRANSLQHLNIGGTFITDTSLFAIAGSCPHLKTM
ncbi:hypothetical protein K7X08_018757 [Anisodus acutangulus]|uniref:Uncharacterized protein n=1 Tax=Anisodus acutangulus TaxID=402998 RepID=A0A9Q1LXJ7_9SOLA|nr:hypothetical protein K7X08_018757 [Anisodus acutangulus]